MSKTNIISESPLLKMINTDQIKERTLKAKENEIKVHEDGLKIINKKAAALNELEKLIVNFQSSLGDLGNPLLNPFETTTTKLITNDVGNADDFLEVISTQGIANREYTIAVKQLATRSNVIFNVDGGVTDFTTDNPDLNGTLSIAINGINSDVTFDGTEINISEILVKINNVLKQDGNEFEAFSMKTGENTSRIEIKAKEGVTKNIGIAGYVNNAATGIIEKAVTNFAFAHIQIDGEDFFGNSNKFTDVLDGMTIIASKINQNDCVHTVKTGVEDPANFNDVFSNKFAPAVNNLLIFLASQKTEIFDLENPEERPPLADESLLLGQADDMINQLINNDNGIFSQMGVALQTDTDPSLPAGTKLLNIIDQNKYKESLKQLGDLKNKFITNTQILRPLNAGNSSISPVRLLVQTENQTPFPSAFVGQDFNLAITIDEYSAVTDVTATMHDGTVIQGVYNAEYKQITFENTEIQALAINFDPKGEVNKTIDFVLNHTEGHINKVMKTSNALYNLEGKGTIAFTTETTKSNIDRQNDQIKTLKTEYETEKTRLDQSFSQINHTAMIGQIMSNLIAEILSTT